MGKQKIKKLKVNKVPYGRAVESHCVRIQELQEKVNELIKTLNTLTKGDNL